MRQTTQAEIAGASQAIGMEADAHSTLAHLGGVMSELRAILDAETALIRAGELRQAAGLEPRKSELAGRYFRGAQRLKANTQSLGQLGGADMTGDLGAVRAAHEELQAALKTNLIVLTTAHSVSEGIVRRLSGELARKSSPQIYGAGGRPSGANPRHAQPLALSRTL
jgi:hypothetical protein